MPELNRQGLINSLNNGWGAYVQRFRQLSTDEQAAFLQRQGYARLGDLLAHVITWWQEGLLAVPLMAADPNFQTPDYNVDEFNARAVEKYCRQDEESIIREFEETRRLWQTIIDQLPEQAFTDSNLSRRLYIEIIGHLQEHE